MKPQKMGPFILLTVLIVIIAFVIGIRYGQSVEKTNKVIDQYIAYMPKLTITPVVIPTIGFQPFTLKDCGVSVLIPSGFAPLNNESPTEATYINNTNLKIQIYCTKPTMIDTFFSFISDKTTTSEAKIINQTISTHITGEQISFILKNPNTGKKIFFDVPANLLPLFQQSVGWK